MTGACGGNYTNFSGHIGIVGTPVIDTIIQTLFVVARSVDMSGSGFVQYLHAIDIRTGATILLWILIILMLRKSSVLLTIRKSNRCTVLCFHFI